MIRAYEVESMNERYGFAQVKLDHETPKAFCAENYQNVLVGG